MTQKKNKHYTLREETYTGDKSELKPWQVKLHTLIYEADTPSGKLFDLILLVAIILSVLAVMLESVVSIQQKYGGVLRIIEWAFTILFTIEYTLRLICISKPRNYVFSFFGIIDLLSIVPTYLSVIIAGSQTLLIIRIIRLLRVFRILKLVRYVTGAQQIIRALRLSFAKIIVFLGAVFVLVCILGTLMYIVESPESGFTSIPVSIYWGIVTLTTVGYGDIAPVTVLGQVLASIIMLIGYAIIAVPTGIMSAEMVSQKIKKKKSNTQVCSNCMHGDHADDAKFCVNCGESLHI